MNLSRLAVALATAAAAAVALPATARAACGKLECGTNSPHLAQYAFHELDASGQHRNDAGVQVLALYKWGVPFTPAVRGDHLVALDAHGDVVWSGDDLIGTYLHLEVKTGEGLQQFRLQIDDVEHDLALWVDDADEDLEAYELSWRELNGQMVTTRPLCNLPPPVIVQDGLEYYPNPNATIFYTGDRYDAATKTLLANDPATDDDWFNLACAGGALYKLYMTRHTEVTSDATHGSKLELRQSMLKMYVSDVCGTGESFTHQGVPLHWQNEAGWGFMTWTEYATEAWWGPKGALCLDVHRLGTAMSAEIDAQCKLPACSDAFPDAPKSWPTAAYVVSRVPLDPI